jgi:class 3 adenylate cyclase
LSDTKNDGLRECFVTKLPSGTIIFLFTDIQGSTVLWEKHPTAMRVALAGHDAILRDAITSNGGVVFKTVGDAFCAAFERAIDAINAALAAQRALRVATWDEIGTLRVRMALHAGAAEERDGDYFGQQSIASHVSCRRATADKRCCHSRCRI